MRSNTAKIYHPLYQQHGIKCGQGFFSLYFLLEFEGSTDIQEPVSEPDPRVVGEWLLRNDGGFLTVSGEHFEGTDMDFPQGDFRIKGVSLQNADDQRIKKLMRWIARMPDCVQLRLSGNAGLSGGIMTNACVPEIATATQLESLAILNGQVTDEGISYLSGMSNIRQLELSELHNTNDSLRLAQKLFPALSELDFNSKPSTIGIREPITRLQELRQFSFSGENFSVENAECVLQWGVTHLELPEVREFELNAVALLATSSKLQSMTLGDCTFGNNHLNLLTDCMTLKSLALSKSDVTHEALLQFRKARPDIRITVNIIDSPDSATAGDPLK